MCAPTQVCHADRCLDPSVLDPCKPPTDEGASCDALGAPGHCTAGVCEPATCGDGYVDVDLREACDDSVPDTHCVDVGYDIGRPACTECQADPTMGCTRFGWERVVDAATTFMWTDGTTLAYVTAAPAALEVHGPAGDTIIAGAFFGVHGANGRVVTWNNTAVIEVAGGAMRTLPSLPTAVAHVRMDDSGTIYTLAGCTVRSIASGATAWTTLGALAGPACGRIEIGPVVNGRARLVATRGNPASNELWEYDWSIQQFRRMGEMQSPIANVRIQPTPTGDVLWISTGNATQVYRDAGTGPTPITIGFSASTISFAGADVYVGDMVGNVARLRDGRVARFRSPTGGLVITGGDRLYAYRGSIYRFTGITRGTRAPIVPATPVEIVASLVEPEGTIHAISRSQIHTPTDSGTWTHTTVPGIFARAFAGIAPTYFISSFDTATTPSLITSTNGIGGPWSEVTVPGAPRIHALWLDPSGTLFAGGDDGGTTAFFGVLRGAVWETFAITGCSVRAISGTDAAHVVAAGECGGEGVVWSYGGAQWSESARPSLDALDAIVRFSDDTIVTAGTSGAAWFDGSAWRVDRSAIGQRLSGTSLDDVWLSGEFTTLQRFDGTVWSRLATSSSGPISVAASPDRVLFPGAADGFVELVR